MHGCRVLAAQALKASLSWQRETPRLRFGKTVAMTRSWLNAVPLLAAALALPNLTGCVPTGPPDASTTLSDHATPAANAPSVTGVVMSMRVVATPVQSGTGMAGSGMAGGGMSALAMSGLGMSGLGMSGLGMSGTSNPPASGIAAPAGGASGGGSGWSSILAKGMAGTSMAPLSSLIGSKTPTALPAPQAVEFTVRMDDGTTQTVTQTNDQGLHTGDRIKLVHGDRARLLPAG